MRSLLLLVAAAFSTAFAPPPNELPPPMNPQLCGNVSEVDLSNIIANSTYLLTTPFNDTTKSDLTSVAQNVLDYDFAFYSDSFSLMDNSTFPDTPRWKGPMGFNTNSSAPFASAPLPSLQALDQWFDCRSSKVGLRGNTMFLHLANAPYQRRGNIVPAEYPVSGIMELELRDKKIKTAYAEFNTAAWYRNIGKKCE